MESSVSPETALHFMETVYQSVRMRMEAGHHPIDAMISAQEMMDTWTKVHIMGEFPEQRDLRVVQGGA